MTASTADLRDVLDGVALSRGWPATGDVARLGPAVAALSDHYNRHRRGPERRTPELQAARLHFFFPRDVEKGAGAVRELVDGGAIPPRGTLRILDVGAGLGATAFGAVRELRRVHAGPIDVVAVDRDAQGLAVARDLFGPLDGVSLTTHTADVRDALPGANGPGLGPAFDLVLLGQTLCELDPDQPDDARADAHAALVRRMMGRVAADGTLVVIEPALREPTRHLHRVRDRLLAGPGGIGVYAPCLHAAACPMLRREGDWCHEHRDVDLPDWLAPVAKAAGLRWEGLTFAFLALRTDGRRRTGRLRVVSEPLPSKGRLDLFLCGTHGPDGNAGDGSGSPEGVADRRKVGRIDRHATAANAVWGELRRGDVVAIEPPGDRVGPDTVVRRVV